MHSKKSVTVVCSSFPRKRESRNYRRLHADWIPACAGMTNFCESIRISIVLNKGGQAMKKELVLFLILSGTCFLTISGCVGQTGGSGEAQFQQHCAACHPKGGNTINPLRTLHSKDFAANNIKSPGDIVHRMRSPGTGMPMFSRNVIPDKEAYRIANYILSTFK
jgi:cytochrome c6